MRNWQIILIVCFCVGLIGLLSGCAMSQRLADSSTDYNLVVEKVQNEMLLLNIVRASKRRPMYFTASTKLTGQMSATFETGSITIPFGKIGAGADTAYSIAPRVSYTTFPTIEVSVLNDKEFFKGMLTPISLETVQDYWQQGWPRELLLNLFVHRIKTEKGKILSGSLDRYYEKKKEFEDFQSYLRDNLSNCNLVTDTKKKEIGPQLDTEHASDLEQLIALNKAGLTLKDKDKGKHQLEGTETIYYFESCLSNLSEKELKDSGEKKREEKFAVTVDDGSIHQADTKKSTEESKIPTLYVTLRSPEAILYYLGEIMRAEKDSKEKPMIYLCNQKVPLFVAREAKADDKDPFVSVDYEGIKYIIPKEEEDADQKKCYANNSIHALSLVSLLISRQVKVSELSPPAGVSIGIGR